MPHATFADDRPVLTGPGFCGHCGVFPDGDELLAVLMHRDGQPINLCSACWAAARKPMRLTNVRRLHA